MIASILERGQTSALQKLRQPIRLFVGKVEILDRELPEKLPRAPIEHQVMVSEQGHRRVARGGKLRAHADPQSATGPR